jgi:PAS domain S-box-containing protein
MTDSDHNSKANLGLRRGSENGAGFSLDLSDDEIELRKRWLLLTASDEQLLKTELDPILRQHVDKLMDEMYEHFMAFDETRSFFPTKEVLNRAKSAQADYFRKLTNGEYGSDYVRDRIQVGLVHHRINLEPKWYLGAFSNALVGMLPLIAQKYPTDADKQFQALSALLKIIFFDIGLAIESYIGTKEFYLRNQRDLMHELEAEKRATKSILQSAPIGIVTLDTNLICLECNDEFIDFLDGDIRENVLGKSLFEIAPRLDKTPFEDVLETGRPYQHNSQILNLRHAAVVDPQYFEWAAWPIKDNAGKISGLVTTFSDVTSSVMLQQQREDFVATLTHDLKTPVSASNRAVRFLLDGDFGPVSPEQREILETMHQSNQALFALVQTLLDVYRFDSGAKELHKRQCNIADVINQVVTQLRPLAREKGINLNSELSDTPHEIMCDEDEIRRVIQNLIDNSLKFTASGGRVTVTLEQNEKTKISVKDTGKGIPEENKPKLFQRFWQAGSTGRHYASTGLGLYLCRRIVEAHGGKIWCESAVGRGSTFTFII